MWTLLLGFLIFLWIIGLVLWLLYRWFPPGEGVYRPPQGPITKA